MADGDLKPDPTRSGMPKIVAMEFKLADLQAGKTDPRGRKVEDILWAVNEFKIYRTEAGISPFFADDPETALGQKKIYLGMGSAIADFNHLINIYNDGWRPLRRMVRKAEATQAEEEPHTKHRIMRKISDATERDKSTMHYERELARCIAQALFGEPDKAIEALHCLRDRLAMQISNRARVVHLGINLILTFSVLAIAMAFAISGYQSVFGFEAKEIALAIMMGAVGALFSTTVRLQSMEVDPTVSSLIHWVYGAQRIIVGGLGALVIYFGFRSGVVDGLFQPPGGPVEPGGTFDPYWLSFICVLAGFSERLVPNLLDSQAQTAAPEKAGV